MMILKGSRAPAVCNAMHRTMRNISVAMEHTKCWWSHGQPFHAYSRELLPRLKHSRGNHVVIPIPADS